MLVAQTPPLPPLPNISANDALLLQPGQPGYDTYEPAANERMLLRPKLRALCKTANAVSAMVSWCRSNNLPFALRSGGHSYEGFSQSASVVIDTRMMNQITFDRTARTMTVGAGATLGPVYEAIGAAGFGFPGGSCPTVGVAGHALGGGFGLIARPFGLACDNLQWLEVVDPQGAITPGRRPAQSRSVLGRAWRRRRKLWRGDALPLQDLPNLSSRRARCHLALAASARQAAFQSLASLGAAGASEYHHLPARGPRRGRPHRAALRRPIGRQRGRVQARVARAHQRRATRHTTKHCADVVPQCGQAFLRRSRAHPTYFKAKSDYITSPLTDAGVTTLLGQLETTPSVVAICDFYGGAVTRVARDATAFAHRAGTLFCIQYFSEWTNAIETQTELGHIRTLYAAMRPYVSGECYVNYCDLDLTNWAQAYWGANLPRLRQIKAAFDPNNIFRHAQSVPVA